jgi:hypothetical protein
MPTEGSVFQSYGVRLRFVRIDGASHPLPEFQRSFLPELLNRRADGGIVEAYTKRRLLR